MVAATESLRNPLFAEGGTPTRELMSVAMTNFAAGSESCSLLYGMELLSFSLCKEAIIIQLPLSLHLLEATEVFALACAFPPGEGER